MSATYLNFRDSFRSTHTAKQIPRTSSPYGLYTQDRCCDVHANLCTCNGPTTTTQNNARYVILDDVVQTLICFDACCSVYMSQDVTREWRSLSNCRDTSQWRHKTAGAEWQQGRDYHSKSGSTSWGSIETVALLQVRKFPERLSCLHTVLLVTTISKHRRRAFLHNFLVTDEACLTHACVWCS